MNIRKVVFLLLAVACLTPWVSSGVALLLGLAFAVVWESPFAQQTRKLTPKFLSWAVIGLGAGMNLLTVIRVGAQGIGYTVITIGLTFLIGAWLGRRLKTEQTTSLLVTVGTAICGGSAIAAAGPVLKAKSHEMSVSLAIVFLLNAIALLIFPTIGHAFGLTERQFGLWSALAIHDTSSVVGASLQYGKQALEIGTTVKLARALWIVPVTLVLGYLMSRRSMTAQIDSSEPIAKPKRPWFILGFVIMAAIVTWVPFVHPAAVVVEMLAKRLLVLTLFLIGSHLSRAALKAVGFRPFVQGICLWLTMASITFVAIVQGWISA